MKTGRYSLSDLLDNDNIEHIIIPEMQRDYVWQPQNVERLLESILQNYNERRALTLEIKDGGNEISTGWREYLQTEYERLRFNSRIGFIYAYYDASDSSALYLIDGQQRITTLFLTLLAIYSSMGLKAEFEERFFKNSSPKLDYKVRETAHRFLVDFIRFILTNPDGDFAAESPRYYSAYAHDPTVKSILANYEVIRKWLQPFDDKESILDYVENFIEFNYFDTGLSRQGERLYLYMNSRGEQLSLQEQIRPTIISRCKDGEKLEAGRQWEKWQHFFWEHRGKENRNADPGFMGFLKLAVILHQHWFAGSVKMKEPNKNEKTGRKQTVREVREDYIRYGVAEQQDWILRYILDNEDNFDCAWLEKVFGAVKFISDLCDNPVGPNPFIREGKWLSEETIRAVNYIPLCGTLLMVMKHPGINRENLYRLGMYLLCRSDDDNNSKNADTATTYAMDFVDALPYEDIRQISVINANKSMIDFDSIIWRNIKIPEWEDFYWELISKATLNDYFNGTHNILIKAASPYDHDDLETIKAFLPKFESRFFSRRTGAKCKELCIDMLGYTDISIWGGNDREYDKRLFQKRKLPSDNEWLEFIDKNNIKFNNFINEVHPPTVNEPEPSSVGGPLSENTRKALAIGTGYMKNEYFMYLRRIPEGSVFPDIVLVEMCNVMDNHLRSLPAHILYTKLDKSWCWEWDYRYCVLDFAIENGEFSVKSRYDDGRQFALEFIFNWEQIEPRWEVFLKGRNVEQFDEHIVKALDNEIKVTDDPTKLQFQRDFKDTRGYLSDGSLDSINEILKWVEEIKPILAETLG